MASSSSNANKVLRKSNPHTVLDKFLVQYNASFTCQGDGRPIPGTLMGWNQWFHNANGILQPSFDLLPDVSDYTPQELFPASHLPLPDGQPTKLFSSRRPKTIMKHFHLMAQHGIDGAFLCRRAAQLEIEGVPDSPRSDFTKWRDDIGKLVAHSAESEGRCYAIMYDLSGVPPNRIIPTLTTDWKHLVYDQGVLNSDAYLREDGHSVLMVKGFPFNDRSLDLQLLIDALDQLRAFTPNGLYIILCVPIAWRKHPARSSNGASLVDIVKSSVDAVCPSTYGAFDMSRMDDYAERVMTQDAHFLKEFHEGGGRKVEYIPSVWPGYSIHNLSNGKEKLNEIKRDGGKFLWKMIWYAQRVGCRSVFGVSWDEYANGTAMLPSVSYKRLLPTKGSFFALDVDGRDLPPDWYMRVCGMGAEGIRDERRLLDSFPIKELQDYWSSRPKYEDATPTVVTPAQTEDSGPGSNAWMSKTDDQQGLPPPPPYSLEDAQSTQPPASASLVSSVPVVVVGGTLIASATLSGVVTGVLPAGTSLLQQPSTEDYGQPQRISATATEAHPVPSPHLVPTVLNTVPHDTRIYPEPQGENVITNPSSSYLSPSVSRTSVLNNQRLPSMAAPYASQPSDLGPTSLPYGARPNRLGSPPTGQSGPPNIAAHEIDNLSSNFVRQSLSDGSPNSHQQNLNRTSAHNLDMWPPSDWGTTRPPNPARFSDCSQHSSLVPVISPLEDNEDDYPLADAGHSLQRPHSTVHQSSSDDEVLHQRPHSTSPSVQATDVPENLQGRTSWYKPGPQPQSHGHSSTSHHSQTLTDGQHHQDSHDSQYHSQAYYQPYSQDLMPPRAPSVGSQQPITSSQQIANWNNSPYGHQSSYQSHSTSESPSPQPSNATSPNTHPNPALNSGPNQGPEMIYQPYPPHRHSQNQNRPNSYSAGQNQSFSSYPYPAPTLPPSNHYPLPEQGPVRYGYGQNPSYYGAAFTSGVRPGSTASMSPSPPVRPPLPPRPSSANPTYLPTGGAIAMPFDLARTTLDKLAGEERRKQLERHAEGVLKTGSKLFNKFTK